MKRGRWKGRKRSESNVCVWRKISEGGGSLKNWPWVWPLLLERDVEAHSWDCCKLTTFYFYLKEKGKGKRDVMREREKDERREEGRREVDQSFLLNCKLWPALPCSTQLGFSARAPIFNQPIPHDRFWRHPPLNYISFFCYYFFCFQKCAIQIISILSDPPRRRGSPFHQHLWRSDVLPIRCTTNPTHGPLSLLLSLPFFWIGRKRLFY